MKIGSIFKTLISVVALLLAFQAANAIKIEIPKEYETELDELKKAEDERVQEALEQGAASTEAAAESQEVPVVALETRVGTASDTSGGKVAPTFSQTSSVDLEDAAEDTPLDEGLGRLSGQVFDKETGSPVSGVAIVIEGTDVGTITDGQGRYRIDGVPVGAQTVSFIKSGYIEANVTDTLIVENELKKLDFALPPRPVEMSDEVYELQDFTVTAEEVASQNVALLAMRQTSIASIDALSSEDFAKFGSSDAADAIKRISGASLSDGKYVVFRGLNDRYNTTLINGVRLPSPDPDRKAVAMDIFPTSLFESIVARKTYTTDLPGESSGGSIELRTKSVPEEPFIKFSFGAGGQMTSSETDTFLSDPEQVSLGDWLKGDDDRGFDLESGTSNLVDNYSNNVGGEGFPLTAPRIKKMSKLGDRSYNLSFGGSKEINDWLTIGGVFGAKVDEKRRTSYKELYKINLNEGLAVLDERALEEDTRVDRNGNTVQHGGVTKSSEEYSSSILLGLGATIKDHTDLNYTYVRAETLTSSVERVDYQQFEVEGPSLIGVENLPNNAFYSYTDYELGSEEKLLEAHQFSGEHRFDFLLPSAWTLSWFYTAAGMEQSEPDQRVIAEFVPDQFGQAINGFSEDPGLPPVTRFQRETEQESTMMGFNLEQEIDLTDSITLGIKLGYSDESSERDFRQLEARIAQAGAVADTLYAAMPFPNQLGLNDVVNPDAQDPILLYNEGFVDDGLLNGVDEVIRALYDQNVGNVNVALTQLNNKLSDEQGKLEIAENSLAQSEQALNAAIAQFEGFFGIDFETEYDPAVDLQKLFVDGFVTPKEANVTDDLLVVNNQQIVVNTAQSEAGAAQSEFDVIVAEQAQYISDANALMRQIANTPALAYDSTVFPTFSFFGNQGYILDTPLGFSLYADDAPNASNIQFNSVDGLFQASGENEVESFFASGNLKFSKLPLVKSVRLAGGFRSESTKLSYDLLENGIGEPAPVSGDGAGVSPFVVESSSIDQRDNLSYLALVIDITDNLKLHLSHSTTVAKPTFREIAPFPIFNLSDKSFEQGNAGLMLRSVSAFDDWKNRNGDFAGKTDAELPDKFVIPVEFAGLDVAEVESNDIRIEYYTPYDGLISVGFFTKTVGAPIERVFAYESSNVDVNTFINNNNDADLKGFEFELQQNLGVLGDEFLGVPLNWITVGGNYTKLDAEVDRSSFEMRNLSDTRFAGELTDPDSFQGSGSHSTRPLYNQPSHVSNAFISFDIEPTGTRITLSQNWTGEQLDRAGGISESQKGVADLYWDEFTSMNLVVEQRLNDTWKLKFAIKNLDSPVRNMFEDDIFYDALSDSALYDSIGGSEESPYAGEFVRSTQKIDPSYSISISATF